MGGHVTITRTGVVYIRDDGQDVEVAWDELDEVTVSSRWMGSFDQRFVWHLTYRRWMKKRVRGFILDIPFETEGAPALRERLGKLRGFINKNFDAFLSSSEEGQFLCWRRSQQA